MDEPRYRIQRASKQDRLYGPIHASTTKKPNDTLCGLYVSRKFWILGNDGTGKITCKKCALRNKD